MQKKPPAAVVPVQAAKPEVKLAPLPAGPPVPGSQRIAAG
jgi:hypothetical protein